MRRSAVVAAVALILVGAGCGAAGRAVPTTRAPAVAGPPATTAAPRTTGPSALDGLRAFFDTAAGVDARLRLAAGAVNAHATAGGFALDQPTLDAMDAADPAAVKAAIPPGLPPELERAVLVVYNDLVSRRSALTGALREDPTMAHDCLNNGAAPSARFGSDAEAARSLAQATPTVAPVAPDSKAAEELAVRFAWIDEVNNGCASCGGMVIRELVPITIYATPTTPPLYDRTFDGQLDSGTSSVYFTAGYYPGTGWKVVLNAC